MKEIVFVETRPARVTKKDVRRRPMCYPCTGCNGCGKLDSELFGFMTGKPRCLYCDEEYTMGQRSCSQCGKELPELPGEQKQLSSAV